MTNSHGDTDNADRADSEPINVGIGASAHAKLLRLKEDGYFAEMLDGYRFAVGLAIAHGGAVTELGDRKNMFNIGTLDPDRSLYYAVLALRGATHEPVFKTVEKLATWGVDEMDRRAETGSLSFAQILSEAESMLEEGEN